MPKNPYAATQTTLSESYSEPAGADGSLLVIARSVFLAWEKIRIPYLISLTLLTVLLIVMSGIFHLRLLRLIVLGAVAANVGFFAGPTIETYVRWLGYNKAWPRWFMFVAGTLLSMYLAVALLVMDLFPAQP